MKIRHYFLCLLSFYILIYISACGQSSEFEEFVFTQKNLSIEKEGYQDSISFDFGKNIFTFDQSSGFDEFLTKYDTVIFEDEVFYVVQGDLMFDIDQLEHYYRTYYNDSSQTHKLVIDTGYDGSLNVMPNAQNLSYAIIRSSFPSDEQYQKVVKNMDMAAKEWSDILGHKVKFEHKNIIDEQLKPSQTSNEVSFVIRYFNAGGKYIASAFFPDDPKYRWKIKIDPSYYRTRADEVGIFRHELGHVLGFRHEHIRAAAPTECNRESDTTYDNLTTYDDMSVMHYPCGGKGNLNLTFTERDIKGARLIYN